MFRVIFLNESALSSKCVYIYCNAFKNVSYFMDGIKSQYNSISLWRTKFSNIIHFNNKLSALRVTAVRNSKKNTISVRIT